MSDLISRSALKEAINKSTCHFAEELWKRVVCDVIDNQPTAYDVEKVVATVNDSIRNCDDVSPTECMKMSCYDCKCKRVEKIIRKGGVE